MIRWAGGRTFQAERTARAKGPEAGIWAGEEIPRLEEGSVFGAEGNWVRRMESLWILRNSAFQEG